MEESVEPISLVYNGYVVEDLLGNDTQKELLYLVDVLIDGKFVKELYSPNLKWKGSANQRVIDVKKTLAQDDIVLYDD